MSLNRDDTDQATAVRSASCVRNEPHRSELRNYVHAYHEGRLSVETGRTARVPISATVNPFLLSTDTNECILVLERGLCVGSALLVGPQARAYSLMVSGDVTVFCIEFRPTGPLAIFGVENYGKQYGGAEPLSVAVASDLKEAVQEWGAALRSASSFTERMRIAEDFLLARLPRINPRLAFIQSAVETIREAGGNVRVSHLARQLGASSSTLRRYFRVLGISPKQFAEVTRFRRAHNYLRTSPSATTSDVVGRFGFCDQSHFVRDYHRFSGAPPTRWDKEIRVMDHQMGLA